MEPAGREDELRYFLSARYRDRSPAIGFYPLPDQDVAPGEFAERWAPFWPGEARRTLVYVHVPFCRQRCSFCRFYPGAHSAQRSAEFLDVARREIDRWAALLRDDGEAGPVEAVFFGGGTPSALGTKQIEALLLHLAQAFVVPPEAEITMEWYPKDAHAEKLAAARASGVDRLSIGVQSWNPRILRSLGAHHAPADADAILRTVDAVGFDNINIDIMATAVDSDLGDHLDDVRRAIEIRPAMISVNLLEIAAGSPLARRRSDPAGDGKRRSLAAATSCLHAGGYQNQRVRNYYRDTAFHRYNRASTGLGFDIVPIGPGAYGFIAGWPVVNAIPFDQWSDRVRSGRDAIAGCGVPTDAEMRRAFVVNSLLELEIDRNAYEALFGTDLTRDFPVLSKLISAGAFDSTDGSLRLRGAAVEFADDISTELFSDFQRKAFDLHLQIGRSRRRSQYFPTVVDR